MYTIKLRNLPNDITEDDIFNVVTRFGAVVKVKIPYEEVPGRKKRNRGFGFVTFETTESASRALE
jgi:RNA recognition motif-containing protein